VEHASWRPTDYTVGIHKFLIPFLSKSFQTGWRVQKSARVPVSDLKGPCISMIAGNSKYGVFPPAKFSTWVHTLLANFGSIYRITEWNTGYHYQMQGISTQIGLCIWDHKATGYQFVLAHHVCQCHGAVTPSVSFCAYMIVFFNVISKYYGIMVSCFKNFHFPRASPSPGWQNTSLLSNITGLQEISGRLDDKMTHPSTQPGWVELNIRSRWPSVACWVDQSNVCASSAAKLLIHQQWAIYAI